MQEKDEGYLWLAILDGSGHLTHTLNFLKTADKVILISLVC